VTASRRLLGVLLVPAATLAACGDGTTDRDALTKIVTDGGRDPVTICAHLSDALLARFGTVDACRKAARAEAKDAGREVRIDRLRIDGNAATATVDDTRGKTTITFVKDHGSWKVQDTGDAPGPR
jgi:hypothetical protein